MTVTPKAPNAVQRTVRTLIALGVGFVVTWAANHGLHLDPAETALLTGVVAAGYTAAANYLESRFSWARVLLGYVGN